MKHRTLKNGKSNSDIKMSKYLVLKDGHRWDFEGIRNITIHSERDIIILSCEIQPVKGGKYINTSMHLKSIVNTDIEVITQFLEVINNDT